MAEDDESNVPKQSLLVQTPVLLLRAIFDKPVSFVRENIVDRLQPKERPVYYHRKFRRVPTIDQCDTDDQLCFYEANEQYLRDKQVDQMILKILQERYLDCKFYYGQWYAYENRAEKCKKMWLDHQNARRNYNMKYSEMGMSYNVVDLYMKQKNRMIYERRQEEKKLAEGSLEESMP